MRAAFVHVSSLVLVAPLAGACVGSLEPPADVEQVVLSITSVPPEVACVRITAAGPGRTVVRELDVTAGSAVTESFAGLPLGTVTFKAEAFPQACEVVSRTTVPTWVSEPAPISIALGRIATVALTMHRNGRARVGVDFAEEPACSATGLACLADGECCSRACVRGTCQPPADAATD